MKFAEEEKKIGYAEWRLNINSGKYQSRKMVET